jgi:hypothetical protein
MHIVWGSSDQRGSTTVQALNSTVLLHNFSRIVVQAHIYPHSIGKTA